MKHVNFTSNDHIKQLLYSGFHIGIKDDSYKSFGGFQRWWYDKGSDRCFSCESHWADRRKRFKCYTLKKGSKLLWSNRDRLYVYTRGLNEQKIKELERYFLHSHV